MSSRICNYMNLKIKETVKLTPDLILYYKGNVRHVQKGCPTLVTQVVDSSKLMRI